MSLDVAEDLGRAIVERFNTQPIFARTAGIWYQRAPDVDQAGNKITAPIVTFTITGITPDWTLSEDFENATVRFQVWSVEDSPAEVMSIAASLKAAFDDATLPVTEWLTVQTQRESGNPIEDPDEGWQYQVDYRIELQKLPV